MRLDKFLKPKTKKKVAVPFAHDDTVIKSVGYALRKGIADFILFGDKRKINRLAKKNNVDLSNIECIQELDAVTACNSAARMARDGEVNVLMKGNVHTAIYVQSLLAKEHRLIPRGGVISQISVFDIPAYHKIIFLTDPGINISPNLNQKVKILKNILAVTRSLGVKKPKVACLAPVEMVTKRLRSTVEAEKISNMKGVFGNAIVEGPIGLDIAVSKEAAQIKASRSKVSGDVDVLLFPEIHSGNMVYKTLMQFGNATAAGMIGGLKVPVVLTSRSDTEEVRELSMKLVMSLE
ncbi:MAG: phosphate butyryltransferase [Fibrobacteria bacterium]|nr:phosphate butyryltransferase [Fibrobacteria bacterium]